MTRPRTAQARGARRVGRIGAWALLAAVLLLYALEERGVLETPRPAERSATHVPSASAEGSVERAFRARRSDVQVTVEGRVDRILADDNEGSRHQRFIVELGSGHRILVSHNIDLAPRLDGLRVGARVGVHGEYEWNDLGGIVHWTHHDPAGRHPGGWISWEGRRYE